MSHLSHEPCTACPCCAPGSAGRKARNQRGSVRRRAARIAAGETVKEYAEHRPRDPMPAEVPGVLTAALKSGQGGYVLAVHRRPRNVVARLLAATIPADMRDPQGHPYFYKLSPELKATKRAYETPDEGAIQLPPGLVHWSGKLDRDVLAKMHPVVRDEALRALEEAGLKLH